MLDAPEYRRWRVAADAALRGAGAHAHPGGGPGTHYGDEDARTALDDAAAVLEFVDRVWSRLEEAAGG